MTGVGRRLARKRALARGVLLFERLWPACWPALGVAGVFVCAALLGLPEALPPAVHLAVPAVALILVGGLLGRALWRLTLPRAPEIDRRLERASGLRHRPLTALSDHAALPGAAGVWQAHQAQMAAQLGSVRTGFPHPGLAARDPHALRGLLIVALAACFGVAGGDAWPRLTRSVAPGLPVLPANAATVLTAWITPPAYTGRPPVFLKPEGGSVSVPAGSHLTVSVTGGRGRPSLAFDGTAVPFRVLDAGEHGTASFQADRDLTAGSRLRVLQDGQTRSWDIGVIADQPPTAAFTEPPGQVARGLALRLPWSVTDDYGVVGLTAELRLRDRPQLPPLIVTIPLAGTPTAAKGIAEQDLTAHPWAGLAVTVRLVARDALKQPGMSETATLWLPQRRFRNPLSRALVVVRQMLALDPDHGDAAVRELDRLSSAPALFGGDYGAFVNLRAIAALLGIGGARVVDAAEARLWTLALHMEENAPERRARALTDAARALSDALHADNHDLSKPGDRAAVDKRTEQLREALRRYMQALADQARRAPYDAPQSPAERQREAADLDQAARDLADAARRGDQAEAENDLKQLQKMLDALQRSQTAAGAAKQRAEQRQRGRRQVSVLQDLVQREGGVLDHAEQRGTLPPDLDKALSEDETAKGRDHDRRVQGALRRVLGEVAQGFGDLTGKIPPALGDADAAMRDTTQALNEGHDNEAASDAQRAIEALQKSGREMRQQMARQFGGSRQRGQSAEAGQGQDGQGESGQGEDGQGDEGQGAEGQGSDSQYGDGGDGQDGTGYGRSARGGDRYGDQDGYGQDGEDDGPGQGESGQRTNVRRDPLGRALSEGHGGSDEGSDVQVPEVMERARSREIQSELRRRGAERERPAQELDYIGRLLQPY